MRSGIKPSLPHFLFFYFYSSLQDAVVVNDHLGMLQPFEPSGRVAPKQLVYMFPSGSEGGSGSCRLVDKRVVVAVSWAGFGELLDVRLCSSLATCRLMYSEPLYAVEAIDYKGKC